MVFQVLGAIAIIVWLLGFVARCMCKYHRVRERVQLHPKEFSSNQYTIHSSQALRWAWGWRHELLGLWFFVCGPVGIFGAVALATMEPSPNGEMDVGFLL